RRICRKRGRSWKKPASRFTNLVRSAATNCRLKPRVRNFPGRSQISTTIGGIQFAGWSKASPARKAFRACDDRLLRPSIRGSFRVIAPDQNHNLTPKEMYPQHECGLFGVFGHKNAAVLTYYGLFALQHRGQESAGIVTSSGPGKSFLIHKDMGLVSQVFGQSELEQLKGTCAIGHTRYSTTGTSTVKNAQTLVVDCVRGQMAIAHNGNLINADVLRDELERNG